MPISNFSRQKDAGDIVAAWPVLIKQNTKSVRNSLIFMGLFFFLCFFRAALYYFDLPEINKKPANCIL
jgi:hypothetical protein